MIDTSVSILTPQENESLDTYNKVAPIFAEQKYTLDFWDVEFSKFEHYLPKGKIVDIGCGWGRDSFLFKKDKFEYWGIDLSPAMVSEAKRLHPDKHFEVMNFYQLNFPTKFFDGCWSAVSLMHAPQENVGFALEQVIKVLKNGGIGFFSCKYGHGEAYETLQPSGMRRYFAYYDEKGISSVMQKNGFKILEVYTKDSPVENNKKYVCCFVTI